MERHANTYNRFLFILGVGVRAWQSPFGGLDGP